MIDQTDKNVLDILMENARTPYLEIAKKLQISESTIRNRINNLEKSGVIKKYSAIIEPSKIGYSCAIVGIDVRPEKFLQVAKKLTKFNNIKFVATSTGDHMLMIEVWMESASELRDFITSEIEKIDGVTKTCPAIINEKLKDT